MADDVIYGFLDVQSPISTPIRVIDYDTQTTNNFINNEIEKRTAYGNGLYKPNLTEDGVLSEGSVVGKIKVSKIPNGLFFNGKRAFTTAEREFSLPAQDGTYSVYLKAIAITKIKTYTIDKATPNHPFSCPDIGIEFSESENSSLGVRIGRVTVAGGTMSVVDNLRDEAKIDAAQIGGSLNADEIDILPKFNPEQFENDENSRISLKTQLSRESNLGHVKKNGSTGIEIFGKFEDGSERYNQIAVKDIPHKFPEAVVSLGVDGLGGKLGGLSQNSFQSSRALIMAIIDGTDKGYGLYKQPKSDISAASTDGNGNTVFTISDGYLFNPLAMYYLSDNTNGGGEFLFGVSRTNSQLTVKGSLKGSYNFNDDIAIEQVNNFRVFNIGTGTEEFSGNTAWTGFFVDFDATPNIVEDWITEAGQFLEKKLEDEYFGENKSLGYAIIWDQKSNGTSAQTATAGARVVRELNQIDSDITGLTLSNDTITLPQGTYIVRGKVPAHWNVHQAFFYSVTETQDKLYGSSEQTFHGTDYASAQATNSSEIIGRVKVPGSSEDFQIQHFAQRALPLGYAASSGTYEVYTQIEIQKIA